MSQEEAERDIAAAVHNVLDHYWGADEPPFDLGPLTTISGGQVDALLKANIPDWQKGVYRVPLDWTHYLCSKDDMARIIFWDWVDSRDYIAERWDCENFAIYFMARCQALWMISNVGLIIDWSSSHAYNIILFPDEVWFFEPQTDSRVDIGAGIHKLKWGMLLV